MSFLHKFAKPQGGNSYMLAKNVILLCAAALVGATANAAATYMTEDEGATLVVEVDSEGATMDASQVTSAITKIKKTGPGTLTAVPLSSYTGDFSIEEGVYSYDVVGDFGVTSDTASAGVIDIKEGAKILHRQNTSSPSTTQRYVLSGKTINLYGGTVPNMETSTKAYPIYMGKNMTIVLKANASISQNQGGRPSYRGTIDLCGYTLTLEGTGQIDLAGNVLNGGKISVGSGALMTDNGLVFDPDHKGIVDIPSGRSCYLNNVTANGWTIQCDKGTVYANKNVNGDIYNSFSVWNGPIELTRSTSKLAAYSGYGTTPVLTVLNLAGPLSGGGSLQVGPGWFNLHNEANTYTGAVTVVGSSNLFNDYGGLGVYNDAPCFPDASSLVFTNGARFGFMDNVATSARGLTFVGERAQAIFGGESASRPTIAGIVKKDSGVLEVNSPVHVTGTTKVDGGTLKIPFRSLRGTPGLVETHVMPKSPEGAPDYNMNYVHENTWTGANNKYNICHPWLDNYKEHLIFDEKGNSINGPSHGLKPMINTGTIDWSDGYSATHANIRHGWWYRGYIWNHSDQPVTYTFWAGFTAETGIFFGEDHELLNFRCGTYSTLFDGVPDRPAAAIEYTLQPGATPIDVFVWGTSTSIWSYSIPTTGERYGLLFKPSTEISAATLNEAIVNFYNSASVANTNAVRTLLRAFNELKDESGTGALFTSDVYGDADVDKVTEGHPVFDNLEFAYGTTFDLSDNLSFQVKDLTGSPIVTNAVVFKITNNWTICSADFPKDDESVRHPMTVDGKLVFAEGATFSVDDDSAIERSSGGVVVAVAADGVVGNPVQAAGAGKKWKLKVDGNEVKLCAGGGLFMMLR